MKSVLSVKMLAALALVLLVSSVTEGRILSKCELKDKLKAALGGNQGGNVPGGNDTPGVGRTTPGVEDVTGAGSGSVDEPGNVDEPENVAAPESVDVSESVDVPESVDVSESVDVPENVASPENLDEPENEIVDLGLIAKIVCFVERVSKFNTNLVTPIRGDVRPPAGPPPRPEQRPNGRPGGRPSQGRPGGRGKRSPGGGRDRNPPSFFDDSSEEDSRESSERSARVPTKLYGIFQLSDRVACSSGPGQSLNICRMDCRALIDDDIRDDIACLQTLLDSVNNAVAPAPRDKKKHPLFVKECLNVNPLQYFAECV
ncbi:uncharacterized protein LOC125271804 isoform X2 [Megalobrama amblycephala]|uniref:uncharacterized protein LOC125271804 isoform X2 n=1 Tax=Megalobrama amblycephala TaxID=75352 RepID=UPI002013C201|nr:uncharacterized protein LOC125271804 isoform X2 [Megalobrama amblycephala]